MENPPSEPLLEEAREPTPNVVRLAEYRRKRRVRARRVAVLHDWGPQYYCLRCDADEFKLYASGIVHCAHCGSLMRNLVINSSKSGEPEQ